EPVALAAYLLGRAACLEREVDPDLRARVGEPAQLARHLGTADVVGDVEAAGARVEEVVRGGEEGRAAAPVAHEVAPPVPAVVRVGPACQGDAPGETRGPPQSRRPRELAPQARQALAHAEEVRDVLVDAAR